MDIRKTVRALRADARAWWYHRELRRSHQTREAVRRERESIRRGWETIQRGLASRGWVTYGYGGATFHYSPNARVDGLHPYTLEAYEAAGIPILDLRGIDMDTLISIAVSGPIPAHETSRWGDDDGPLGPFDTLEFRAYARWCEQYGARIVNRPTDLDDTPIPECRADARIAT